MEILCNIEKESILNGLKSNLRLDGRLINQIRNIKILLDRVNGNSISEISLGDTKYIILIIRVSAVTSSEVVPPHPDRPYEGIFKLNIIYAPMANKQFVVLI